MRKLFLFMNVSLDGYVEGPNHDLSWAHGDFEAFSAERSREVDTVLLGRRTYEMMRAFWPTPQAAEMAPEVAAFMNRNEKVVAAHDTFEPGWNKVTVLSQDVPAQVKRLKEGPGGTVIILGSNTLATSLLEHGLIDEVQVIVNPVALGAGTSLFAGLRERASLRLVDSRTFKSGAVLLTYERQE